MSKEFIKDPGNLALLLEQADPADLDILVDYITDNGKGRISLNNDVSARLIKCKERQAYTDGDRKLVGKEILAFGGNTLSNVYRDVRRTLSTGSLLDKVLPDTGESVPYEEVVKDVASHLKVAFDKKDDVLIVEDALMRKLMRDAFERMSAEERADILRSLGVTDLSLMGAAATAAVIAAGRAGGFATFQLTLIVANALSRALLGRGLPLTVNAAAVRTLGIALGPIAWAVTGAWGLADMASPAYRVTVPCVVQIAYMRQKAIAAASTQTCGACGASNEHDARFCSKCGAAMEGH